MKKLHRKLAGAIAIPVLMATAGVAGAADVTVSASVSGGTRTLAVKDLLGNNLSSTGLNLGNGGSLPFQVEVQDTAYANEAFTVEATMTNLYVDNAGNLDLTKKIASSNLTAGSLATPVAATVSATVEPVFDTVTTINDLALCTTLLMPGASCQLAVNDVSGVEKTVNYASNQLGDLNKLPIVPQAPASGAFTNADYTPAEVSGDTAAAGAPAATPRQMLGGAKIGGTHLDILESLVTSTLGTLTNLNRATRATHIAETTFQTAVQSAVVALGLSPLTSSDLGIVMDSSSTLTRDALTVSQVLGQTGTYRSYPTLTLTVPEGAAAGSYRGILVVTDIQP